MATPQNPLDSQQPTNVTAAAPVPMSLDSANTNTQFPGAAPQYMNPTPVYTQQPPTNNWANTTTSVDASGAPSINYVGGNGTGATGNYQSSQIVWNPGQGYVNPNNHNQTVQQSIDAFSDAGGAYLTNATRRGLEAAASRGVLNSSIAAGAANRSAIEAMTPYVQQAVDLGKTREGFAFQSGENALDRSLQVAVENGRLSQSMAELLASHTFQGNQAEFDRTLKVALAQGEIDSNTYQMLKTQQFQNSQNALDRALQTELQAGRIAADEAAQIRQIGFQSMQAELDRSSREAMQSQQFAYQGEQNALDRAAREKLQSDATFQQDWLSSRNFSREFQSQLSLIPLSAAADLTSFISKYAVENPDVYTPEIVSGMSNFMSQNMANVLGQYFPDTGGTTTPPITPPAGGYPPVVALGGGI